MRLYMTGSTIPKPAPFKVLAKSKTPKLGATQLKKKKKEINSNFGDLFFCYIHKLYHVLAFPSSRSCPSLFFLFFFVKKLFYIISLFWKKNNITENHVFHKKAQHVILPGKFSVCLCYNFLWKEFSQRQRNILELTCH
jgi:hypothetical protein